MTAPADRFLAGVPVVHRFGDVLSAGSFAPVPDDWFVGTADIVDSTGAVAAGRYKIVNLAGAAVIAGVANALGGRDFPFVFGGDGASFAVPPQDRAAAIASLSATAVLVSEEFGLALRIALVPVREIRAAGHDLRLAFFAASPDVNYAMFAGGGLAWAEAEMKRGAFGLPPGPPGARPDLTGLSCRFDPIESRRGTILSVIVRPADRGQIERYRAVAGALVELVEASPEMARPLPVEGPPLGWPPRNLAMEARISGALGWRWLLAWPKTVIRAWLAIGILRLPFRLGRFDPRRYRRQIVGNTDYRKYDDGLRMTIDCTPDLAAEIEARLVQARADGIVVFGLHRQAAAVMTCFTPSAMRRDHVHFVDGATGGYASAAAMMKLQAAT